MADLPAPSKARLFGRALRRRCPFCGGRPFDGFFRLAPRCHTCGLLTDRVAGHWVGAVGINTIVSFAALLIVLVAGIVVMYPDLRVAPLLGVTLPVAALVPVAFWPLSQTLWTAIDIAMRPVTSDEVDPRYAGF